MAERCPEEFIAFAHRLADRSGEVIRRYFRQRFAVESKADESPVTIADREAERTLRAMIADAYPDHGVIGEELGTHNDGSALTWIIDPIDGTGSFITGKPIFGTLIALWRDGKPLLGVIDQPVSGERWIGAVGHGTTLNGTAVHVRACGGLDEAFLDATDPRMFEDTPAFETLRRQAARNRWGSDCYAYAMLASGHVDIVVERKLKLWDYATLVPIIEEAGGIISDWRGRPLRPGAAGDVLAAGDVRVHQQARDILGN